MKFDEYKNRNLGGKERADEKEVASIYNPRMAVQSAPVYGRRQVADLMWLTT